ncbi:hypothetical protein BT63DRAFT_456653 [Microthyrium microscopicum]|uniref:Uncharacterized protein n=1 Tax=Microthyrium microscopicum TaxID=703497 RepID=A0A6A6U4Y3_9PEZI|nr:hypothetical protein BT63DRAFT_456653 [Microthyrium microscopicum]
MMRWLVTSSALLPSGNRPMDVVLETYMHTAQTVAQLAGFYQLYVIPQATPGNSRINYSPSGILLGKSLLSIIDYSMFNSLIPLLAKKTGPAFHRVIVEAPHYCLYWMVLLAP